MYVGVDACKAGWVLASIDENGQIDFKVVPSFEKVVAQARRSRLTLVDMPIGLRNGVQSKEERPCDPAARKVLGRRRSSVFPVPIRELIVDPPSDYQTANEQQKRLVQRGLSRQSWCLLPKLREVDNVMRTAPDLQEKVRETHPEICFWCLNWQETSGRPMRFKKKSKEGEEERVRVLRKHLAGLSLDDLVACRKRLRGVALDDMLDALAAASHVRYCLLA